MARMKELSTKLKRESIYVRLKEIADSLGATVEREPESMVFGPRRIYLRIYTGNYWVAINLDGKSRAGGFLGHWNTERWARYPKRFRLHDTRLCKRVSLRQGYNLHG